MCCLNPNANSFRQGILRENSFTREATAWQQNSFIRSDCNNITDRQTERRADDSITALYAEYKAVKLNNLIGDSSYSELFICWT